jgi:hypothetical protein
MEKIIVTIPLVISLVSYFWAKIFEDDDRFPGGPKTHLILIIFQGLVILSTYMFLDSLVTTYIISLIYFSQAIGVIYFLNRKGNVSCGCFGSQVSSRLSKNLIFVNILLSVIPLIVQIPVGFNPAEGLMLLILVVITTLVFYIGIPDAVYSIKGYTEKGNRYLYFIKK